MHTVLIIIAIFIAIVLLVNSAAPQAKPLFKIVERLPTEVIIAKLRMLGASCAVTKKGFGIKFSCVKPKRLLKIVMRNRTSDKRCLWQAEFINNAEYIIAAFSDCKKDIISGAYCGHVNGFPRIFLFCKTLCECSGGDVSRKLLSYGLSAFEQKSKLTDREREILPAYLSYCLIGCVCTEIGAALRKNGVYEKGASDGQNGKVALDYIDYDDYICGLLDYTSAEEWDAVRRLLEYNGFDIESSLNRRKKDTAFTYAMIKAALRSLQMVYEYKREFCHPTPTVSIPSKQIAVSNAMLAALIVVYGIFTCVFASPRYVALFAVASVLTYIAIRIPLLNTVGSLWDYDWKNRFFKKIKKQKSISMERSAEYKRGYLTETACFGGCTEYEVNSVNCGDITVRADNRGKVFIDSVLDGRVYTFGCDLSCRADETDINLSECDGVFERHKTSYRLAKRDLEFSAQILSAFCCNACLIELGIVNRTAFERSCTISAVLTGGRCGNKEVDLIDNGAAIQSDGYCVALRAGDEARYGGNLREFLFGKPLRAHCNGRLALIGQRDIFLKPFEKKTEYLYVVFGKSKREAESVIRYGLSDGFFEYASDCAEQYCVPFKPVPFPKSAIEEVSFSDEPDNIYDGPRIAKEKSMMSLSDIELLPSAEYVSNGTFDPRENILSNGKITAKLNRYGVQSVSFGKPITAAEDDVSFSPQVYVVIGENNVLWSPSLKPLGKGETVYKNGFGYCEYTCAYNGTLSRMRCFICGDDTLLFDVKIKNEKELPRELSVMFSLLTVTDKLCYNDGVISFRGEDAFFLYSSQPADSVCLYKEGYFNRGRIDRVSSFRDGGNTPAPTLTLAKSVEPNGEVSVSFALSSSHHNAFNSFDMQSAFNAVTQFYNRLGKIGLHSDDNVLNISYKRALYVLYNYGFLSDGHLRGCERAFVYGGVKYINSAAVKEELIAQTSRQRQNGELSDNRIDGLYFAYSVMDYVNYSCDKDFLREVYSFLPIRSNGKTLTERATVYEHCLRAIDSAVGYLYSSGNKLYSILHERMTLLLVNFFTDYIKQSDVRESRLFSLYRKVAERYAQSVKYLKSNRFFKFENANEAYLCSYLLFAVDENEKAYNILKYNNPLERLRHYDGKTESTDFECGVLGSAIYYLTVTEMLLGISVRGKRIKICPKTSVSCPQIEFDLYGRTKDVHVSIDSSEPNGSWKMRVDRINYSPDSVDVSDLSGDIVFYRDGRE